MVFASESRGSIVFNSNDSETGMYHVTSCASLLESEKTLGQLAKTDGMQYHFPWLPHPFADDEFPRFEVRVMNSTKDRSLGREGQLGE